MKQFASWFTHGVAGGGALRKAIYEAKTGVAVLDAVERFFEVRLASELPQGAVTSWPGLRGAEPPARLRSLRDESTAHGTASNS